MVTVLAAPQHNNYDKESKVLEVNRDHWSALNPHRYESGYSHELHRLWNNLMVKGSTGSAGSPGKDGERGPAGPRGQKGDQGNDGNFNELTL